MRKSKEQKKLLVQLVQNALDFLETSISELRGKPKYSVIHFHAAIELILKARLLEEHWTLVVSPKKEADWQDFVSGSFVSVSMEEATKRLDKVVQSGLNDKQIKAFRKITKHRNRMVHFFHEVESKEAGENRLQAIVKEQLTAWYFLHDLLLKQWDTVFSKWNQQISAIDKKLREHHEFLRAIFNDLKIKIEADEKEGYEFLECPSCGFNSDRHISTTDEAYNSECLVCGLSELCIRTSCSECEDGESAVLFRGAPEAECRECGEKYDSSKILEIFIDETEAYLAVKDGGDYPFPVNCGECCGYETVVEISEGEYLCTQCFLVSQEFGSCGWCNDESTGLSDDTFWSGCEFCEGRSGWDTD